MAQGLFDEAKALMAAGKTAEACPKLEESQRLDPASGTLMNLAKCYEKRARTVVCHGMSRYQCDVDPTTSTLLSACKADTETCVDGACVACAGTRANCDDDATDCETDLGAVSTCGKTCESRETCTNSNATRAACTGGACTFTCASGFEDCDGKVRRRGWLEAVRLSMG